MLRALWFFFQLAVVVCAAIWIASRKGAVDVVWGDYTLSLHLGIFLLFLVLFTLTALAFFRLAGWIVSMPGAMSRRRREKARIKGFKALTKGFAALAANDSKKATHFAREVRYLLPEERGLPLLLEAQAARLRGEEGAARASFEQLLDDKDAAFLGVRGLLKSALDEGDVTRALTYARQALQANPKQSWILKSVYDLELQNHLWREAYNTLERVKKARAMDERAARKDEVALLMLLAEQDRLSMDEGAAIKKIERAAKIDPGFTPAAVKLGEHYLVKGNTGKASSIVEKAWKVNPHPDLVALWDQLAPENKPSDPMRRMRWFEKLAVMRPDSPDGQIAVARVAIDSGLWGDAKAYLVSAEKMRPTAQVFRLRADLEEQTTHNPSKVRDWLDQAANAAPETVWYCRETGHIYDRWMPVALPHGAFNTIEWGHPLARPFGEVAPVLEGWNDPLLIEHI